MPSGLVRSAGRRIVLRDGAVVRLDQNTTITFTPPPAQAGTWIDLLTGAVHFFSRTPRGLRITTPFVNGSVEGTEFLVEVDSAEARISVWEGRVLAENAQGSLSLTAGQSAAARAGQAPVLRPIVVKPTDAVAWALYYPPVVDLRPADFPDRPGETWPEDVRRSLAAAQAGRPRGRLREPGPRPRSRPRPTGDRVPRQPPALGGASARGGAPSSSAPSLRTPGTRRPWRSVQSWP